jgi:sugar phosphate isomerase/epimerase
MNRRDFIALTGTLAAGMAIDPLMAADMDLDAKFLDYIGLQLYTIRDDMGKNPVSTLRQVAQIGYKHVEATGYLDGKYYGLVPKQYKALLDDLGLNQHSGHVTLGLGQYQGNYNMLNNWDQVCEDAASIGQRYVVLGWIDADHRKTMDDYKKLAEIFNKAGETANRYQLQFAFHNHDFEFVPVEGQIPYDYLLANTNTDLVKYELDHYWTTKAKVDSMKLMKKHVGRFPLFHLKDMNKKTTDFAEVGTGRINYKKILAQGNKIGMQYFYVEQDSNHNTSPLKSVDISYRNLTKLKV